MLKSYNYRTYTASLYSYAVIVTLEVFTKTTYLFARLIEVAYGSVYAYEQSKTAFIIPLLTKKVLVFHKELYIDMFITFNSR